MRGRSYSACGVRIRSAVELEGLATATGDEEIDLEVLHERVPDRLDAATNRMTFVEAAPDRVLIRIPGVGRMRVDEGSTIRVDPGSGPPEAFAPFVRDPGLGLALEQRGALVLRGAWIARGDGTAAVLSGFGSSGRSSLAFEVGRRGARVGGDGVVALEPGNPTVARPAWPDVDLWADACDHFGLADPGPRRVRPGVEKFRVPLEERYASRPGPVDTVYWLRRWDRDRVEAEAIEGWRKVAALERLTFRPCYADVPEARKRRLLACVEAARGIDVVRLSWPKRPGWGPLEELASLVLDGAT